ncbi:hypothetical protein Q9966_009001 [Columba livia]|nr:hypothetical protein Q9966_009001 [Columba livia]
MDYILDSSNPDELPHDPKEMMTTLQLQKGTISKMEEGGTDQPTNLQVKATFISRSPDCHAWLSSALNETPLCYTTLPPLGKSGIKPASPLQNLGAAAQMASSSTLLYPGVVLLRSAQPQPCKEQCGQGSKEGPHHSGFAVELEACVGYGARRVDKAHEPIISEVMRMIKGKIACDPEEPVVIAPVGFKGAYDDIIPPWVPDDKPVKPSAPPPAEENMEVEGEATSTHNLGEELRRQKDLLLQVLEEMQQIDGGASKSSRARAYQRAADAIKEGLEGLERNSQLYPSLQLPSSASEQMPSTRTLTPSVRKQLIRWAEDGETEEDDLDTYLRSKYGPESGLTESERQGIRWFRRQLAGVSPMNPLMRQEAPPSSASLPPTPSAPATPCDPNFDMRRRWKGIVTNAELTGEFCLGPLLYAPVHTVNNTPQWQPLEWTLVSKLQNAVMSYGIDNTLVRRQVTV